MYSSNASENRHVMHGTLEDLRRECLEARAPSPTMKAGYSLQCRKNKKISKTIKHDETPSIQGLNFGMLYQFQDDSAAADVGAGAVVPQSLDVTCKYLHRGDLFLAHL